MNCWRITKYNPIYRDSNGNFVNDDWTSIYDIGKSFKNNKFTLDSYLLYENLYIDAIKLIMRRNNTKTLVMESLEKNKYTSFSDLSETDAQKRYNSFKNGLEISYNNIDLIIRMILREIIWCKLISDAMFVHFGYDFYMYVGCNNQLKNEQDIIEKKGLFVEEMSSPYM